MSIKVMTDVWSYSKAQGTSLLVLLALADNANDAGECWPSIKHIGEKCRIDTRTAQRRIRDLEKLGEVVVIIGGGKSSANGMRSNRYRITVYMPDDEAITDLSNPGNLPPWQSAAGGAHARGGVAPTPGGGVAPTPPEPSFEPSMNRQAASTPDIRAEALALLVTAKIERRLANGEQIRDPQRLSQLMSKDFESLVDASIRANPTWDAKAHFRDINTHYPNGVARAS